jgi:thiamine-phosphate pyrophosphorylase
VERLAWWAQVFMVPCVGVAHTPDEVEPLARAGADFIMPGLWLWQEAGKETGQETEAEAVGQKVTTLMATINHVQRDPV